MPRKASTQWDFGELFPPAATRRVLSVTDLTLKIKGLIEQQVGEVWVSGEVSNLRVQSSGHSYFTLKDANAQLSCVLFRGAAAAARVTLRDGQKAVLQGEVTVYEPRGQYQLVVRSVELAGVGALQAAFERLKAQLAAEGLFDPARKRPLPKYPRRLGVVTSPTGAALRDVLHVLERRYAGVEILLAPCRVQGAGAEQEIAAALGALNAWSASAPERELDALLVTRGGGSLEDLWAFNEEVVARAIATSKVPVISGVGHEIDFTIADFVADVRAATPSAAAEILTAGYVESREALPRWEGRLRRVLDATLSTAAEAVAGWERRLRRAHPRRRLNEQRQRVDELEVALVRRGRELVRRLGERVAGIGGRLAAIRPSRRWRQGRERLDAVGLDLQGALRAGLTAMAQRVEGLATRLRLLSPEEVLARGYSITLDAATGQVVRRASDTAVGRSLRTRLHAGEVTSVVVPAGRAEGPAKSPGEAR